MNEVVKSKWTSALRSGEYPQTTSCLRDDTGFCCLGVLTDLAIKDGVIGPWEESGLDEDSVFIIRDEKDGNNWPEASLLPYKVMEWAGLDSRNPLVSLADGSRVPISDPNDSGVPFEAIADMIDGQI